MFSPRTHNAGNRFLKKDKGVLYKADMGIKALIFDLGNVLISFDHQIAARKVVSFSKIPPGEIFSLFFDSDITGFFEEGKISSQDFYLEVKERLGLKLDYSQFSLIWNEIFFLTEDNLAVYHLAKGLRKKYKVALLSNINILHFEYLKDNFSIFDIFHNILTSFELGLRKPDPLIYRKAIDVLGVSPDEVFYTDDRDELIAVASKLGIHSYVFRNFERLKQDLLGCGIIGVDGGKSIN